MSTPGTFVNSGLITCATPAFSAGTTTLTVKNSGAMYSDVTGRNVIQFSFYNDFTIDAIHPTLGSVTGSRTATLYGDFAMFDGDISVYNCKFGTIGSIPSIAVSTTAIQCNTPIHPTAGVIPVSVTANDHDYTANTVAFLYQAVAQLTDISTPWGSELGGTVVTVQGSGFSSKAHAMSLLQCKFGAVQVLATYVTSTEMLCQTPASGVGTAPVDVSNDHFFPVGQGSFDFLQAEYVTSVTPVHGPISGSTTLTLDGGPFDSNALLRCRFGAAVVSGVVFSSSTRLKCLTPAVGVAGDYSLELSQNALDYTSSLLSYHYYDPPQVTSISISSGGPVPGVPVTVFGSDFKDYHALVVLMGSVPAPSTYASATAIVIVTPTLVVGAHAVEVSNNGIDFTANAIQYTVIAPAASAQVATIFPTDGSMVGGTEITVDGTILTNVIECIFGVNRVAATVITSTQVKCMSPPSNTAFAVALEVTTNGFDVSANAVQYSYIQEAKIFYITPSSVPASAGSRVVVFGQGIANSASLSCKFGVIVVPGVYNSSNAVTCTTPTLTLGDHVLEISNNAVDYSNSNSKLTSFADATVTAVSPLHVRNVGGAVITVHGSNFFSTPKIRCKIASSSVAYIVLGQATDPVGTFLSATEILCKAPAKAIGVYTVEISHNAIVDNMSTYTNGGAAVLTYFVEPVIASLSPTSAYAILSHTMVLVTGSGFQNLGTIQCKVGTVIVPGAYLSPTMVACTVHGQSPGGVAVEISLNNDEFTADGVVFTFLACPAGHSCSSATPTPCPKGSYCQQHLSDGGLSAAECLPGTYQDETAQTECKLCPVGTICSMSGLQAPLPCPAGSVCSSLGILHESVPCPPGMYCLEGTNTTTPCDLSVCLDAGTTCYSGAANVLAYEMCRSIELNCTNAMRANDCLHQPIPCPPGTYCSYAVAVSVPVIGNYSTPQLCTPGSVCPDGSISPLGSGPSPASFYAVDGFQYMCPIGHFCGSTGLTAPSECLPGTFSPGPLATACTSCTFGMSCPTYGLVTPSICPAGKVCDSAGLLYPSMDCPAGHYCNNGTNTADPTDLANPNRPYVCVAGSICLGGVIDNTLNDGDLDYPQSCWPGTYCKEGTTSPFGTDKCPQGYYCPEGSVDPIPTPVGTFANKLGTVSPVLCPVGTFADTNTTINCKSCPGGHECTSDGTASPSPCNLGTYRPNDDNVQSCLNCPMGTYSDENAMVSINQCKDCPMGRVCAAEGLTSLAQSLPCPAGYVCGTRVTSNTQYDNKCPAGFYCIPGATPFNQFDHPCEPGYYCREGTGSDVKDRYLCPNNYYCPGSVKSQYQYPCPNGTMSNAGAKSAVDCMRNNEDPVVGMVIPMDLGVFSLGIPPATVFGDPSQQPAAGTGGTADPNALADGAGTGSRNATGGDPLGGSYWIVPGTVSPREAVNFDIAQEGCQVSKNMKPTVWSYSTGSSLEYFVTLEQMQSAVITFDLRSLSSSIVYGTHFNISIYVDNSTIPHSAPNRFLHDLVQVTGNTVEFTLFARKALGFRVAVLILHGAYANDLYHFKDIMSMYIQEPYRFECNKKKTLFSILTEDQSYVMLPLNRPPKYSSESFEHASSILTYTSEDRYTVLAKEEYTTISETKSTYWVDGHKAETFSYLPFVSNCLGFDSYPHYAQLFEDKDKCKLVEDEDVTVINTWEFGAIFSELGNEVIAESIAKSRNPGDASITGGSFEGKSDTCDYQVRCSFEEQVTTTEMLPRWYEYRKANKPLFYLSKSALGASQYETSSDDLQDQTTSGDFVAVGITVPDTFPTSSVPGDVIFEVKYYQKSKEEKSIVSASLTALNYRTSGMVNGTAAYTLTVKLTNMDYGEMLDAFEFDYGLYVVLYLIIGVVTSAIMCFFWLCHRLCTRVKRPSLLRPHGLISLSYIPALKGVILAWFMISGPVALIYVVFILLPTDLPFTNVFETTSSDWKTSDAPLEENLESLRNGRFGSALGALGLWVMYRCACLVAPLRKEEKHEDMEGIADSITFKRSHFYAASIITVLFLMFFIRASFSDDFTDTLYVILVALKLGQIFYGRLMKLFLKEQLLVVPIMASLSTLQFVLAMAAGNFSTFVTACFLILCMSVIESIYLDPVLTIFELRWPRTKHILNVAFSKCRGQKRPVKRADLAYDWIYSPVPMIENLSFHATEQIGFVSVPFLIVFIWAFDKQLDFSSKYNILNYHLIYFQMFTTAMLVYYGVMGMFIHNVNELHHGWRVYDYLKRCSLRYRFRRTDWKGDGKTFDQSLLFSVRTLDQFCYSSQFYFVGCLHSIGIIVTAAAVETVVTAGYNPFADPYQVVWTLSVGLICFLWQNVLVRLGRLVRFWRCKRTTNMAVRELAITPAVATRKQIPQTPVDETYEEKLQGAWIKSGEERVRRRGIGGMLARAFDFKKRQKDKKHLRMEEQLRVERREILREYPPELRELFELGEKVGFDNDQFAHRFAVQNRPWILSRMHKVFTPRTIKEDPDKHKAEFLGLGLPLLPASAFQDNVAISDDSETDDDQAPTLISLDTNERLLFMMWYQEARYRLKRKWETPVPLRHMTNAFLIHGAQQERVAPYAKDSDVLSPTIPSKPAAVPKLLLPADGSPGSGKPVAPVPKLPELPKLPGGSPLPLLGAAGSSPSKLPFLPKAVRDDISSDEDDSVDRPGWGYVRVTQKTVTLAKIWRKAANEYMRKQKEAERKAALAAAAAAETSQ